LIIDFSWGEIAELIPNRNAKQCRERWCYNLDPSIKRDSWTVHEDAILVKAQRTLGNQWALIARYLKGRTENSVKTRMKSLLRAEKREWSNQEDELIMQMHLRMGSKWEAMKAKLPGRTANAIKTRYMMIKKGVPVEQIPVGSSRQIWHQQHLIDKVNLEKVLREACGDCTRTVSKSGTEVLENSNKQLIDVSKYLPVQLEYATAQVSEALKGMAAPIQPSFVGLNSTLKPASFAAPKISGMNNRIFHALQNLQNEILQDQGINNESRVKLLSQTQEILSSYLSSVSTSSIKQNDVQIAAAALLSSQQPHVSQLSQLSHQAYK